ncbi:MULTISPECIES: response regulator transcription factor [Microbacterium]|uniref:Alkaline phosphatase synthesis transcriptional regulatory protein PhoP n=1 Tax=Microbacterium trichothecenolyticum TaxID=69370 RepID=A0A0M2H9J8_MICTR|nr:MULTISPECIES: response regulator transcription factor [Microbacterium]KJL40804.1 Alkaline phosphatase synthesis transcriptional regulatory protein PhoP [Microbacterium trichothecenolyticum]MDR7188686.1 DNA-binding response OmpR family regulator [Microbacterium sp. BE35]
MSTPSDELKTAVIIEDDKEIRHVLAEVLESSGFSTVSVGNGIDGVRAVLTYKPVLTTIDVNMPGIDGIEAAKRIRAQSDTYIIMLTGMNDEADVIAGLGAGADDYLLKPFRPRELRARVEALMRRRSADAERAVPPAPAAPSQGSVGPSFPGMRPTTTAVPTAPAIEERDLATPATVIVPAGAASVPATVDTNGEWLTHRDLRLHPENRIVLIGGEELDLTRTEFDLLATLLESKRRVRSKADLTLVLRGESYVTSYFVGEADKRAVEAHMTNLRRKLGESAANPRYIETVRGVGYRLTSEG